eukprot:1146012-Pelagomonas_calceolata.AAC.1
MGFWRVGRHAPGCPDSPSPALLRHAPSKPSPKSPLEIMCVSVSRAAVFELGKSAGTLGSCSSHGGIRVGIRAEFKSNKVNVPIVRRNLNGIKVGRPTSDRAHKDSIRAPLVSGRGASTIGEDPVRNSIHTDKGRPISALAEGFDTEAKANMMPIGVRPIHCWVKTSKGPCRAM